MYTRSCLDPLAPLPSFFFRIQSVLSIQRPDRLDLCSVLMYVHGLFRSVHLTDNPSVQKIPKFVPHFNNLLGRHSNLLVCGCRRDQYHVFRQVYLSEGCGSGVWSPCPRCEIPHTHPQQYEALAMYGPNMVGLEGAEWKRHRAIAKTAFNEANNAFVWQETIRIVNEWFIEIDDKAASSTDVEGSSTTTNVDLCRDLTRATLLVIASAGFGRHSTWRTEENGSILPPGHKVHLSRAITDAVDLIQPRVLAPKRLWKAVVEDGVYIPLLGRSLLRMRDTFEELRGHMIELVSQARDTFSLGTKPDDHHVQGAALLKNMVQANLSFEGDEHVDYRTLTDEELLSNMFVSSSRSSKKSDS